MNAVLKSSIEQSCQSAIMTIRKLEGWGFSIEKLIANGVDYPAIFLKYSPHLNTRFRGDVINITNEWIYHRADFNGCVLKWRERKAVFDERKLRGASR